MEGPRFRNFGQSNLGQPDRQDSTKPQMGLDLGCLSILLAGTLLLLTN